MILSFLQSRLPAWPVQDPVTAGRTSEIAAGQQAQILVLWGGEVRNERALFGRRDAPQDPLITSERRERAWQGAQTAVWETQRCLVPIAGFRSAVAARGGPWICEDPGPLFAAGLRSSMQTQEGFHLSCFSLLTEAPAVPALPDEVPVLIGADDVIEWLYLDGQDALRRLDVAQQRRFVSVDALLRGPLPPERMH
ncbi:SOS response-associated peptidase family protein [Xanthomonas sp. LMG 12460]|uniref:SOS response-associated peptidase family protein n=1 Tax=Xanthomonas sp. LMG 12460 TaxID=1591132 RepID=UPI0012658D40|nr:SOS response-associated peptidase family protein [Xanthomonas sp. LMG 12460]KAB7776302.1 hypothetical protein CEK66_14420 [Xanthomonas sp. LMG 12460]